MHYVRIMYALWRAAEYQLFAINCITHVIKYSVVNYSCVM